MGIASHDCNERGPNHRVADSHLAITFCPHPPQSRVTNAFALRVCLSAVPHDGQHLSLSGLVIVYGRHPRRCCCFRRRRRLPLRHGLVRSHCSSFSPPSTHTRARPASRLIDASAPSRRDACSNVPLFRVRPGPPRSGAHTTRPGNAHPRRECLPNNARASTRGLAGAGTSGGLCSIDAARGQLDDPFG